MYTNKQIWNVSYPIFLSLLAQNVINVTDTAFLGRVGEVELGASAMGGLYYICAFTIAFGFSTGSQIIMARRNGERNYKEDTDIFRYDSERNGRVPGLACVRVLFLFCECDVSCIIYRYYPDESVDIECDCDGVDECAAGLSADIR